MRLRIERFLQTRLRNMLAPATIGLGLAMTGCPSSGLDATEDAGALVKKDSGADVGGPVAVYSAPAPDAGGTQANRDTGTSPPPSPRDGAVTPDAVGGTDQLVTKYMAQVPDAGQEAPLPMPEYMAPMPDAAQELPMAQPDYMAQMPDSGPVLRYMAQMPDAAPDLGGPVAVYLAQLPGTQS
jgi:hypothetical protein